MSDHVLCISCRAKLPIMSFSITQRFSNAWDTVRCRSCTNSHLPLPLPIPRTLLAILRPHEETRILCLACLGDLPVDRFSKNQQKKAELTTSAVCRTCLVSPLQQNITCTVCNYHLSPAHFSKNELKGRVHIVRCNTCMGKGAKIKREKRVCGDY
jgi:hypothetical protein